MGRGAGGILGVMLIVISRENVANCQIVDVKDHKDIDFEHLLSI